MDISIQNSLFPSCVGMKGANFKWYVSGYMRVSKICCYIHISFVAFDRKKQMTNNIPLGKSFNGMEMSVFPNLQL
jgi:hypothetical protein